MAQLKGKVVLITGGTSGIGAATAKRFQQEGATVVVTGSSAQSVAAAQAELEGIHVVASDAADPRAAKALVEDVIREHGRIDVLFVNAGMSRLTPIEYVDEATFDQVFGVNFRGPYFLLKHAVPAMADGGSILLMSSTAAVQGIPALSAYAASKAALRSIGATLAVELAPRRIRVNTLCPGFIDTPFSSKIGLTQEQMAGFGEMVGKVPLGRMGNPEEVVGAALYLASDESRYTTGAELRIDGGLTLV